MGREYSAEFGRKLGWDLAHYGWDPREDAPVDVIEGHTAGKGHFGSRRKTPDRFERKWLQLRQSAIRRGRVVDESVTPEFIASIDHPICSETLVEMTHSTRQDTDWSVDRVNNEGAYADGNLVVMSVRANRAKRSKTYQAVDSILTGQSEDPSLGKEEWARLRCIMLGACNAKSGEEFAIPLLTRIPNRCTRPSYFQLQHIALVMAETDADTRNAAIRSLNACHLDKGATEHLKQATRDDYPMFSSDIWFSSNARSSFESGRVPQLRAPATDPMAIHEFGGNHSRSGAPSLRMRRRPVCAQYSAHICIAQR